MNFDRLFFFFVFYSFLGFLLETVYRSLVSKRIVYPGFLFGPYCPIYGFGLISLLVFLVPVKDNLILFLISAFFLSSLLEYVTGYLMETLLDLRLWDYSKKPLNINGRISLEYSIYWTLLSYLFIYWIHPFFEVMAQNLEKTGLLSMIELIMLPVLILDTALSVNKAIYTKKEVSAIDLILKEMDELKDSAGERIDALKSDLEALLSKLMRSNRNLFIYGITSRKFPDVVNVIKETGKRINIKKLFKEDKR